MAVLLGTGQSQTPSPVSVMTCQRPKVHSQLSPLGRASPDHRTTVQCFVLTTDDRNKSSPPYISMAQGQLYFLHMIIWTDVLRFVASMPHAVSRNSSLSRPRCGISKTVVIRAALCGPEAGRLPCWSFLDPHCLQLPFPLPSPPDSTLLWKWLIRQRSTISTYTWGQFAGIFRPTWVSET